MAVKYFEDLEIWKYHEKVPSILPFVSIIHTVHTPIEYTNGINGKSDTVFHN
jgi:hypothetical protein